MKNSFYSIFVIIACFTFSSKAFCKEEDISSEVVLMLNSILIDPHKQGLKLNRTLQFEQKNDKGSVNLEVRISAAKRFRWKVEHYRDNETVQIIIKCSFDDYQVSSDFMKNFVLSCASRKFNIALFVGAHRIQ